MVADATAKGIEKVAAALSSPGGRQAANLEVAKQYVDAFGKLAKESNTMIIPGNFSDISGMVASAMATLDHVRKKGEQVKDEAEVRFG